MAKRHPTPPDPGHSVSVPVRVRPGAGRTRVGGRYDGPHGPALIVAVGAPAVDGKATEAVRRALAAALGVRPGTVALRLGATSRDKVFTIDADGTAIQQRLQALRDGPTTPQRPAALGDGSRTPRRPAALGDGAAAPRRPAALGGGSRTPRRPVALGDGAAAPRQSAGRRDGVGDGRRPDTPRDGTG
jgi:uncharacterized protein YggU (UPF0235/DUF167 family)